MSHTIHGYSYTRLYRIWDAMRRRGTRKHAKACYIGVTVCEEWQKFIPFMCWARDNGYTDELVIDRIDGSQGYHPDNCRWVTYTENNRNRSNTRFTIEDVREIRRLYKQGGIYQREIAEMYGVNPSQISQICSGKRWADA